MKQKTIENARPQRKLAVYTQGNFKKVVVEITSEFDGMGTGVVIESNCDSHTVGNFRDNGWPLSNSGFWDVQVME